MKWTSNGLEPTQNTIDNFNNALTQISQELDGLLAFSTANKVSAEMSDGVTFASYDGTAGHKEIYENNPFGSKILRSKMFGRPTIGFALVKMETVQAVTGLVSDVPNIGFGYLITQGGKTNFINEGIRAAKLSSSLLPHGMKFEKNGLPTIASTEIPRELIEQQQSEYEIHNRLGKRNPNSRYTKPHTISRQK